MNLIETPRTTATVLKAMALTGLMSGCAGNISDTADTHSTTANKEARKPNIVFVLTDQWRAQATGYSGDPNLIGKTPKLDQIANSGINFKNAISTTPVCTPYRAALLTGQYPTTTGMIFNDLHLPEESYTIADRVLTIGRLSNAHMTTMNCSTTEETILRNSSGSVMDLTLKPMMQ
jgi:hypothetical protein